MILVELADGALEREVASDGLELLHQVRGAGEQNPPVVLRQGQPEGGREVGLAATGAAEQQEVGALLQLGVARGERHRLSLAHP